MRQGALVRTVLFAAFLAVGAAGCSSAASPSGTSTPGASAPGASAPGNTGPGSGSTLHVPRPFEALSELASDQQRALHDAAERAVAKCMKAQGFQYTPRPFEAVPQIDRGLNLGDIAAAQAHGYGVVEAKEQGDQAVASNDPSHDPNLAKLSPAERQAFSAAMIGTAPAGPNDTTRATLALPNGAVMSVNTSGCASKGRSAVYGDDVKWQELVNTVAQLTADVYQAVGRDAQYADAVRKWRACMTENGFDEHAPGSARESLAQEAASGATDLKRLKAREVEIASTDAECFQRVDMAALTIRLIGTYEQEVGNANQGVIVAFRESQRQAVERAKTILGS